MAYVCASGLAWRKPAVVQLNLTETEFGLLCQACRTSSPLKALSNAQFIDFLVKRLLDRSAALACKVAQLRDKEIKALRQRIEIIGR
jgi:hypothetical protein